MDSSFKHFASPVSIMQSFLRGGLWRDTAGEKGLPLCLAAARQGQHVALGTPVMTPAMSQKGWSFCNLTALACLVSPSHDSFNTDTMHSRPLVHPCTCLSQASQWHGPPDEDTICSPSPAVLIPHFLWEMPTSNSNLPPGGLPPGCPCPHILYGCGFPTWVLCSWGGLPAAKQLQTSRPGQARGLLCRSVSCDYALRESEPQPWGGAPSHQSCFGHNPSALSATRFSTGAPHHSLTTTYDELSLSTRSSAHKSLSKTSPNSLMSVLNLLILEFGFNL